MKIGGYLFLSNSQLNKLPATFGNITVGGDLYLGPNPRSSSWPKTIAGKQWKYLDDGE